MSQINVDIIRSRTGTAATCDKGLVVSGVTTSTTFSGAVTGNVTGSATGLSGAGGSGCSGNTGNVPGDMAENAKVSASSDGGSAANADNASERDSGISLHRARWRASVGSSTTIHEMLKGIINKT